MPRTPRLGWPHVHVRRVESTNSLARELAARGVPHGTLVSADEQTAGRGRQGRAWSAPAGTALLGSWVIREPGRLLSLAAGVAVAEVCDPDALLKWPNDVLIDGRKVAGILVEARPQEHWAVLGIGINAAVDLADLPPELRARAGTLRLRPDQIGLLLSGLTLALARWLSATDGQVLAAVRERDALCGRRVAWEQGEGRAIEIDRDGHLVVELDGGGMVVLDAGEVHLLGG